MATQTDTVIGKLLPASLAGKITLGFSVIGLLLVVNLINAYLDSIQTNKGLDYMVEDALPIFTATTDISRQVQQLEPIVLTLLDSETDTETGALQARLDKLTAAIAAGLKSLNSDSLSPPLATSIGGNVQQLAEIFTDVRTSMNTIQHNQSELINVRSSIADISTTLAAQEKELKPLLNDIVFEMDDDYLISLMFEFSASANAGQVIIAKIQASTDREQINELQVELASWITDYKSLQLGLPASAGTDPKLYRELLTKLSKISNIIIESAQGVYVSESNDYINGLQSIKAAEINLVDAQKQALAEFRQALSEILQQAEFLVGIGSDEMNNSASEIEQLLGAQQRLGLASGVFGIALVLIISLLLTRYFKASVALLRDDLTQLEQGHLVAHHNSTRRDEFGKLIRAVQRVTGSLRDIVSGISLANSAINDGISQVTQQSLNTRNYVEGQKQELDQVATALTEMAATASEVANHASDTHGKVSKAEELAVDGRSKVGASREMVIQVRDQAARTMLVINSLNDGVQNIESILATIGGIAEQTNLLALNAAIEAARAGEQGRGFAVVADEVRALASRTQDSTQEIRQMTDTMLKESNDAVAVMEQSAELISRSVDSVQLADDTIAQFDEVMKEVLDLSHLIATASEEQALTVNELNKNVMQVSTLAEQTQESAETSQATSEQLRRLASELREKVARFSLE